jgi:dimethylargininase
MHIAITRAVSPGIARCELTHLPRAPVDYDLACAQHRAYERALESAGCEIVSLPAEPELPDSVFVEDAAVVLDEIAILTRPGAPSRRPEVDTVAAALASRRPLARIEAPATLDGGDVLPVGRAIYVGLSGRTNREGVGQLRDLVARHGYEVHPVVVTGCLHLKSAATLVAPGTLLVNPAWTDTGGFRSHRLIEVDPAEPYGANSLRIGDHVIYSSSFPRTRERLTARGVAVIPVDVSEVEKAEGAVTCCSIVFHGP